MLDGHGAISQSVGIVEGFGTLGHLEQVQQTLISLKVKIRLKVPYVRSITPPYLLNSYSTPERNWG